MDHRPLAAEPRRANALLPVPKPDQNRHRAVSWGPRGYLVVPAEQLNGTAGDGPPRHSPRPRSVLTCLRSTYFWIFPVTVIGKPLTKRT